MATIPVKVEEQGTPPTARGWHSVTSGVLALAMIAYVASEWPGRGALLVENLVLPALGMTYLLAYFWGWGAILGRLLRLGEAAGPTEPLAVLGLGLGGAALSLLVVGMLGGFGTVPFLVMSVAVIAAGQWLLPVRPPVGRPTSWTYGEWTLLLLVALVVLYFAAGSLMPMTELVTWDVSAYHLAMGKIYQQQGQIANIPWMPQSNFPIVTDLVFFHSLLLGGDRLAVPLNVLLYLVCAAAIYRIGRLHVRRSYALVATLAFLVTPGMRWWVHNCYVEIGWTCFATLSLWCAFEWRARPDRPWSWLHLSGIFAGLAVGTKLPGVFGAAAVGVLFMIWSFDRRRPTASLAAGLRYGAVLLAVLAPVLLKTYLHIGTPVWPLSLGVFEVRHWNEEIHRQAVEWTTRRAGPEPLSVGSLVLTAWQRRGELEFMLLILLGIGLLLRRQPVRLTAPFVWVAAMGYLVICMVTIQARFFLPAVPAILLGLLVITAPRSAARRETLPFGILWTAIVLWSLPPWLANPTSPRDLWALASGAVPRSHFQERDPLFRASRMVRENTTLRDKILLFGEVRGSFLEREYAWGDPLAQTAVDYPQLPTADHLHRELQQQGFSHVLFARPQQGDDTYPPRPLALMETLLLGSRLVAFRDGYELYDIREVDACFLLDVSASLVEAGMGSSSQTSAEVAELVRAAESRFANLVVNGSFENGFEGWRNERPDVIVLAPGGVSSETAAAVTGLASADPLDFYQLRQVVAVDPGEAYTAGALVRTRAVAASPPTGATVEVVAFATDGRKSWRAPRVVTGTQDWTLVTVLFRVPPGVERVELFAPRVAGFYSGEMAIDRAFVWKLDSCREARR